jgi:hypothetical protein
MDMKKPKGMKMPSKMTPEMPSASAGMPRFGARALRPGGMAKGGDVHPDAAMDRKLIRKEMARAEKMEDKKESKGMKKGGMAKMAKGGGVESKGKTKGKFI